MGIRTTVIALGIALALAGAGLAVPSSALAGSVTIESHRSPSTRNWSSDNRPYPGGDRNWRGGGWDGHHGPGRAGSDWGPRNHGWRHHDGWDHRHGYGWSRAPVWVPPHWAWNGWGWVYLPGYWH